jgi:tetraacyldisaccharide 4'-kinase
VIQQIIVRLLLLPFTLIYGAAISLRNLLYEWKLLKSVSFSIPVIGVGNLSIGGAGKTPHVEYLIRLLNPFLSIATLSRGYKRKTHGFRLVNNQDDATTAGDEPIQFFKKFRDVAVAVSESRSIGIPLLLKSNPGIEVILLDDSFQHRSVTPGLNILITDYNSPYSSDFLLPAGRLREWKRSADRADIIIVSKCPNELTPATAEEVKKSLDTVPGQHVFFSKYRYLIPYHLFYGHRLNLDSVESALLICAIANVDYLLSYLNSRNIEVYSMQYEDHHYFSPHDLSILKQQYSNLPEKRKIIITTEKDATRLALHRPFIERERLPIFILPVEVEFLLDQGKEFDDQVKSFLINFKV